MIAENKSKRAFLESVYSVTIDEDRLKRMNERGERQRGRDGRRWARVCKEGGEGRGGGEGAATEEYGGLLLVYCISPLYHIPFWMQPTFKEGILIM